MKKVYLHLAGSDFCVALNIDDGVPQPRSTLIAGFLQRLRRRRPDIAAPAEGDCTISATEGGPPLTDKELLAVESKADLFVSSTSKASNPPAKKEQERPQQVQKKEPAQKKDEPHESPFLSLAKVLLEGGRIRECLEALRMAHQRDPHDRQAMDMLVSTLSFAKRYNEVVELLGADVDALAQDADRATAYLVALCQRSSAPFDRTAALRLLVALERNKTGATATYEQGVKLLCASIDALVRADRVSEAYRRVREAAIKFGSTLPTLFAQTAAPVIALELERSAHAAPDATPPPLGPEEAAIVANEALLWPLAQYLADTNDGEKTEDKRVFARVVKQPHMLGVLRALLAKAHQLATAADKTQLDQLDGHERLLVALLCESAVLASMAEGCNRFGAPEAAVELVRHNMLLLQQRKDSPEQAEARTRALVDAALSPEQLAAERARTKGGVTCQLLEATIQLQHSFELLQWFGPAIALTHRTLAEPRFDGRVPCRAIARLFEPLFALPQPWRDRFFAEGSPSPLPEPSFEQPVAVPWTQDISASEADKSPYTTRQMKLLTLALQGFKLLFLAGFPQLASTATLLTPALIADRGLHLTVMRNSVAYNSIVLPYAAHLAEAPIDFALPRIYVVGDSHSLTSSWQTVTINGQKHLLCGRLVTGCKIWHLRDNFDFITRTQFWRTMDQLPRGAKVVLVFGEIDCREGIVKATQRGTYSTMEEGFGATIDVYERVLDTLQAEPYCFDLYVHPAIPGVDVTREIVHTFDNLLRARLQRRTPSPTLHFIDIADKLVTPDWKDVLPELVHDQTHVSQKYVPMILEPALQQLM